MATHSEQSETGQGFVHGVPDPAAESPWDKLTERERQVAFSLACGMTNREIAEQLSISIKTVDTHRGHVMKKLGTKNNVELLRYMLRNDKATL